MSTSTTPDPAPLAAPLVAVPAPRLVATASRVASPELERLRKDLAALAADAGTTVLDVGGVERLRGIRADAITRLRAGLPPTTAAEVVGTLPALDLDPAASTEILDVERSELRAWLSGAAQTIRIETAVRCALHQR